MPRNRVFFYGSVDAQGDRGRGFVDIPETNVGNIGWQEGRSPCHAQERGKSGL